MTYPISICLAALLTGLFSQPADAQVAGLTNADIVRLLAMRVSDQTAIAVIREATATRFDLSAGAIAELAGQDVSSAVIVAMRQVTGAGAPLASAASAVALPEPEPAAGAQTLAGAAAEAASRAHIWPLSTISSSELPPKETDAPGAALGETVVTPADETSWRARVGPLHQTLREDRAKEGPLVNRINKLTAELSGMGPASVKRRGVETERQKLSTELTALHESLRTDLAATQTLEDEGRRAGVPPEWFR